MKLIKAMTTIGGFTMLSRIAGFVRDIFTAAILGAGPIADAFFVALKLPNLFRRITAEGAFSIAFVPLFSKELEKNGEKSAIDFAREAQSMMVTVLMPFVILMILAMPYVIAMIAPGFNNSGDDTGRYALAVSLSQITFPYILWMSLTAMAGGILNAVNRFAPFAAVPIIFNICLIFALALSDKFNTHAGYAMSYGVFAAGILQFAFMLWSLKRAGLSVKLQRPKLTPRIKKLFKLMGPGMIGAGAVQLNLLVDMILASTLPAGAVSYLYYADRLYQLPLSVIGIAIGSALLPMLSKALEKNDHMRAQTLFSQSIQFGLLLAIPAAVALSVIAAPIINVLFQRGAFDAVSMVQSSNALLVYAIGLPAFVLTKSLSMVFFAKEDIKTPVKFVLITVALNIILGLILIGPFKHVGIAMATSIAAWVNCGLLATAVLIRQKQFELTSQTVKHVCGYIISALVMGVGLYLLWAQLLVNGFYDWALLKRVMTLGIMVALGFVSYFGLLFLMRILKVSELRDAMKKS